MSASKNENHILKKYGNIEFQKKPKPKRKSRIKKALEILNKQELDIIQIDANHFRVKSQSDPEKFYSVTILDDYRSHCDCKDFLYNSHGEQN